MKLPSPRAALLLACLPLLPGCNDPISPRDELNDARRRWQEQGATTYAYAITRSCECLPEYTRKAWVQVVDGTVTAAHFFPDFTPVPPAIVAGYPTVDDLFDMVEQALEMSPKPDILVVRYDPRYGYPTRFELDPDVDVGDDERAIYASDLTTVRTLPGTTIARITRITRIRRNASGWLLQFQKHPDLRQSLGNYTWRRVASA